MARPKKSTVDYFPHDTTHGSTMQVLESKWGNNGYAFWFKLLELLGSHDNHYIDCRKPAEWEFMTAKTLLDDETASNILQMLSKLEAIDSYLWMNHKVIFCPKFLSRIEDAYRRRKESFPTLEKVYSIINVSFGELMTAETPQNDVNDGISTERERERERERKVITPPARMTLKNIRDSFREIIGVELGGGVNQSLSEIGMTYTPETINFALLATSTRTPKPTNPFMYFKSILEGKNNGHSESSGKSNNGKPSYDSCENRDYSAGEVFDRSDKW